MAELLMICPTRGRPASAAELWAAWQVTTTGHADLCLGLDDDDPQLQSYLDLASASSLLYTVIGPRLRMVGTLNAVANRAAPYYPHVGFLGDDHRPRTHGWDRRFCECLSGGTGVVYGNDLLQGREMPTAVAMTSDIVTTLGYMAPPAMVHLCVDLVWRDWGEALDRITYLDDVVIEHLHPAAGKAAMDESYAESGGPERVVRDGAAYHAYRDDTLQADVKRLKVLLQPVTS